MDNEMSSERSGKWRVLVVDDEEAARYGMRRALGGVAYGVEEAGSVEDARKVVSARRPDLLLLDVNLPGVSGLEYLRELAAEGEGAPLVVMRSEERRVGEEGRARWAADHYK